MAIEDEFSQHTRTKPVLAREVDGIIQTMGFEKGVVFILKAQAEVQVHLNHEIRDYGKVVGEIVKQLSLMADMQGAISDGVAKLGEKYMPLEDKLNK